MDTLTNEEYKMKRELQGKFKDIVMSLIGDEISILDAYVYADKYLEHFGVNDMKSYIAYYNKGIELNKTLPSDLKSTLMHDLMLTRDKHPQYCVPRTAYTIHVERSKY